MPSSDWTPSTTDVGRKLSARTIDESGNELGAFTTDTRPTLAQVQAIIGEEVGALAGFVGADLPSKLWGLAKDAVLNGIAARIELDFWPEQVQSGRSPYEQLAADRDRQEGRLISAIRAVTGTGEGGGRSIGSILTRPSYATESETAVIPNQNVNDTPPYAPTSWPVSDPSWGAAGTIV